MTTAETIATVLAAHYYAGYGSCSCGYSIPDHDPWSPTKHHRAHVAAAIAEALGSSDDGLRERVEALAIQHPECWIARSTDFSCIDYVGGEFSNGSPFTDEMCCLPCRIRAAITGATS